MTTALTETQLILDALRAGQTAAAWESACARAEVNWDTLAVRAIVLGLAPQLHYQLTQWRLPSPAPRAAAKLALTYQRQAQRSAAIFAQLAEVLRACDARGLRPVALKGIHLAALVYAEPALRPMNDIDLLFTPEELPEAEALLMGLGYRGKHKSSESGPGVVKHTSTFKRDAGAEATPNPYLSSEAERMVEPHSSLTEAWFGLTVDVTPGVRERAVALELAGQPARGLAREDLLLHLCVHFCFHYIAGAPAMVQLLDLKAVAEAGGIAWAAFTRRAIERQAAPFALAALSLAANLLDAPVQAALPELARATPEPLRGRAQALDLAALMRRTQQPPLTTLSSRLRRGLSDRAEAARWTVDWRGQWRVWRTALAVARTDTGQMLWHSIAAKSRNSAKTLH